METTEGDTGCDVVTFRQAAPLIADHLTAGTVSRTISLSLAVDNRGVNPRDWEGNGFGLAETSICYSSP